MAAESKRSKGRFLYLFDWNAKSRKKLFSNKSESSEGSSQGKENVDDMAVSQYFLRELNENGNHTSFRGSGNYSCVSSINGDDGYGTKAPGVVARLMGLDTMPATTSGDASSVSSYESRTVSGSYYPKVAASYQHEHRTVNYSYTPNKVESLPWNSMASRTNKFHGRPIERFQTEVLPPKSAKPISITHHKLLSPIKSPGFIPTKDAAYIMEVAARMIDPAPHSTGRAKISSLGSPSSSFRIQDLRDKMDAAQRSFRLPETPRTPKESPNVQQARGTSSDRSSHRSLFKNIMGSQTSSSNKTKNKGKAVSVAVQDKTKGQKKDGSVYSESRSQLQKERKRGKLKQKEPHGQMKPNTQKAGSSRVSSKKNSGVLRQNNDKQNSFSHKDKFTSKLSVSDQQLRKIAPGDNSAGPSKIVNKVYVNAENGSKKAVATTNVTDKRPLKVVTEKRPSLNRIKNISRSKQIPPRNDRLGERVPDKSGERAMECDLSLQGDSRKDMDVISFTFTSPIKKSGSQSLSSTDATGTDRRHLGTGYDSNGQADTRSSMSPPLGLNLLDSGSLSRLLEQKLQELTDKIGTTKSDATVEGPDTDLVSCLSESVSTHGAVGTNVMEYDDWSDKDQTSTICDDDCSSSVVTRSSQKWEDFEGIEEYGVCGTNKCEASRESDLGHLNTSVPECSVSGNWVSSTNASDFTYGNDQPSSPQSQDMTSSICEEGVLTREDETDFADATSYWEVEYVRYMLHYASLKRFRLVEGCKIIDPGLFDLLENLISTSGTSADQCSKLERRIIFDCVSESISARCQRAFLGSYKAWGKWVMLLQNEWLIEEVYKEIFCWQSMGNLMVDELVDWDMSTQYGRWLDFETESLEEGMAIENEILASLLDELVADLSV